jgi:hypothetical protein
VEVVGWTAYMDNSFAGKPEGKRPFAIPRCRWKDNIKINLIKVGKQA